MITPAVERKPSCRRASFASIYSLEPRKRSSRMPPGSASRRSKIRRHNAAGFGPITCSVHGASDEWFGDRQSRYYVTRFTTGLGHGIVKYSGRSRPEMLLLTRRGRESELFAVKCHER
jgi:hypothetical protein